MITHVVPTALMASIVDVVSNVTTTASVVTGGAPVITLPPPAGTDEASALATANTSLQSATFLLAAAQSFLELGRYAGSIGYCNASYEIVDGANGSQFL